MWSEVFFWMLSEAGRCVTDQSTLRISVEAYGYRWNVTDIGGSAGLQPGEIGCHLKWL